MKMKYVIQTAIVHTAEKNYKRTLPIWWQNNILHVMSLLEQRGYFIISKSCNTTAYASNQERPLRMLLGKLNKLIHIWADSLYPTLHRGCALESYVSFVPYV